MRTRAVAYRTSGPIDAPDALVDIEIDIPDPEPHDLLVEIRAVSVNPVDVKLRASSDPDDGPRVLGFDAAGVVREVGRDVSAYSVGDEVFYAGSVARPGTDAGLHLVDERIVGHKPTTLDFDAAAAMPLTAVTAWEALFDKLAVQSETQGTLLVMAGAGGVGSMLIQLARQLTKLTVIGTASRPDSVEWVQRMGAHRVVNHHRLADDMAQVAPDGIEYIFTPFSAGNIETFAQILTPRGQIVAIDEPEGLDLLPLKAKSQSWHWELMFTRSLYEPESTRQREILDEVARLVDAGTLHSTMTTRLAPLNAASLIEAHRQVETSSTIGKVVVAVE
jgi:NADPH:quinone reductase